MATPMEYASRMTTKMLNDARKQPGTTITKERGGGQNARFVAATYNGTTFDITLLAWGFPVREFSGLSWSDAYAECAVTLEGAG